MQCLGIEEYLTPFSQGSYQANDQFVLCSDGFHTIYPERVSEVLHETSSEQSDLQTQVDRLITEVIQKLRRII